MLISFKSSSGFIRREGETQKQAILRVIAQQLVEGTEDELDRLVVDEYALDKYIGERPFVLLVDQIDALSPSEPLNVEAAYTLRALFVQENRHLLMSTLIPMGIESVARWNVRGYKSIPLPLSNSLKELRAMSTECSTLTPLEVAMHGGIPSLLYSVKVQGSDSDKHYRDRGISSAMSALSDVDAMYISSDIVEDFITGEAPLDAPYGPQPYPQIHRQAYHFAFSTSKSMYIWPLCYMQRILADMRVDEPSRDDHLALLSTLDRLTKRASAGQRGKEWELVLQIGILLNCIGAMISRGISYPLSYPRFQIMISDTPEPRYLELPPDIATLDGAWSYLSDKLSRNREAMFTLVVPTHADFPMYDLLLVYTPGFTTPLAPKWGPSTDRGKLSGYNVFVAGIQARARPGGLSQPIPAFLNSGSYIAYGHSADKASVRPPSPGWVCLSEEEVQRLLGFSLAPLRYIDWSEA